MLSASHKPIYRDGIGDETGRLILHYDEHGQMVGELEYRFAPGYTCEIVNFEVKAEHRSKGIGSSMIQILAEMEPARTLYSFVQKSNTRMLDLYRKLGFTIHEIPNYYNDSGDGVLVVRVRGK